MKLRGFVRQQLQPRQVHQNRISSKSILNLGGNLGPPRRRGCHLGWMGRGMGRCVSTWHMHGYKTLTFATSAAIEALCTAPGAAAPRVLDGRTHRHPLSARPSRICRLRPPDGSPTPRHPGKKFEAARAPACRSALVTSRSAAAGPDTSRVHPLGSRATDTVEKTGCYTSVLSSKAAPQFK